MTRNELTAMDPKTIMLISGALGAVMSIVLYLLKRSYPPSIRGVELWATSLAMSFLAGTLFSTIGKLPTPLSTTLPSLLTFFGPYVGMVGTQRFFGAKQRHLPWIVLILAAASTSIWFTYMQPDYSARLQLSTAVVSTVCLVHAWLMWRKSGNTLAGRIALCVLVCAGAVQLMRFVTARLYPAGENALDASAQNVTYLAAFAFAIVLIAISQVLLATERLREELERAATRDSLTDAYTRRYMKEALQRELSRCLRHKRQMAVLLIDIDHFKKVNDTLGHLEGDRVLTEFVANIKALLRGADLLGRFGGEEFVVLLPETTPAVASSVAQRVRSAMSSWGGPTVSVGVTSSRANGDSVDALLARADAAMYRAKSKGRNRVETA
jgi:diguanylate cyclase (GGDEF)-like protein